MRAFRSISFWALAATTAAAAGRRPSAVNQTMFHGDRGRTGWNAAEPILTPSAVSGGGFGPIWNSSPFDAVEIGGVRYAPHVYASPLYVDDLVVDGVPCRAVIAATSNGYVYAVNAFANQKQGAGALLWKTRLGTPTPGIDGGVPFGVLSTPAIDLKTSRVFVTADTTEGGRSWKVFALDLATGSILPGWPLTVEEATVAPVARNGPARFQAAGTMSQRGALNLSPDGRLLYVPFGAYNDNASGWLVAIDTEKPSLASAFAGAPAGERAFADAGIWGSGGPAVDEAGNVYATTGNGPPDVRDAPGYWGESLLAWSPGAPLQLAGTYTPWNYCQMDDADTDLGGDSPIVIPDLDPATTLTPRLVVFGSKQGTAYLIDRDRLPGSLLRRPPCNLSDSSRDGSLLGPDAQPPFAAPGPLDVFGPYSETYTMANNARARTTPAYFRGGDGAHFLFYSGATKQCESCVQPVAPGLARLKVVLSPRRSAYLAVDAVDSELSFYSPGSPVVTSDGPRNAIVWVLDANLYRADPLLGPNVRRPVLYAIDAMSLRVLWRSQPEALDVGGKYGAPVVAHGVVFVGTDRIQAFGISGPPTHRRPATRTGSRKISNR